jgi:hypothetical protein
MGLGPTSLKPSPKTKGALLFCGLVILLLALVTIVAIVRFVPGPLIIASVAIGMVALSAAFVEFSLARRSAALRASAIAGIQLLAVAIVGIATSGLHQRAAFIVLGALLIITIHIGTASVNVYRRRTLSRLSRTKGLTLSSYATDTFFASNLESRSAAYYGLIVGFGVGLVLMQSRAFGWQNPMTLPLLGALIAACAFLLFEICRNGTIMADPLFDGLKAPEHTSLFVSGRNEPLLRLEDGGRDVSLISDAQIQEIACAVADLRSTVFWSSVFAATIFFALSLLIIQSLILETPTTWLVLPTLGVVFLLVQLPYVWGQVQVHASLLEAREGVARVELSERLQKLSPLLPRVPALIALTATGTAGGLLYIALSKIMASVLDLK